MAIKDSLPGYIIATATAPSHPGGGAGILIKSGRGDILIVTAVFAKFEHGPMRSYFKIDSSVMAFEYVIARLDCFSTVTVV
jgi:hypothetical protein